MVSKQFFYLFTNVFSIIRIILILKGTIITIRGRLFTSSVNSIQELENDLSETKEIVR